MSRLLLRLAVLAGVLVSCAAFVVAPRSSGRGSRFKVAGARPAFHSGRSTDTERISVASLPAGGRPRTAIDAAPRQVTAEELEREMTEWDLPLILDVFAVWCGPCLMLKPEIVKVAEALDGKCRVLTMDSDEESDMASTLNVFGLPTVLYMKDGVMKHRTEGSMPAEEILQLADIHFFGATPPEDPADGLFIDASACEPTEATPAACSPPTDASACQP